MVSVTIRVPSDTRKGGRQQETREFGTTRRQLLEMADWLRCWGVTAPGWRQPRLLEAGLLPAGTAGAGSPALPGVAGQGAARAAEERQAGLGLAGQGHRAGVAGRLVRAAGGHQAAAHPYPLPAQADPGPDRGKAAGREAAGGRAPEAVGRDQRRPRRLRPRHAGGGHRRRAEPEGPGGPGPGRDAPQARPAGRGPGLLVLHPRARLRPADDAGQHRPLHRPDRRAGRADRRLVRAVRTADRPARRHPRLRRDDRPGPDRRDRHRHERRSRPPATCAPGPGSPPGPRSPAAGARARARPAAATPMSALPSARRPPAPAAPRPSSAPSSGACAGICRRRRPRAPS